MEDVVEEFNVSNAWGISTFINVYDCDPDLIKEEEYLRKFIVDLVDFLGMQRHGEPIIDRFGNSPKLKGYSFAQMIETSSITAHFSEYDNIAYIDIFSCKGYDPEITAEYCMDYFNGEDVSFDYIFRK